MITQVVATNRMVKVTFCVVAVIVMAIILKFLNAVSSDIL